MIEYLIVAVLIVILISCAVARPDESCTPEHTCANCKHCPEHGSSKDCEECTMYYPCTPNWEKR